MQAQVFSFFQVPKVILHRCSEIDSQAVFIQMHGLNLKMPVSTLCYEVRSIFPKHCSKVVQYVPCILKSNQQNLGNIYSISEISWPVHRLEVMGLIPRAPKKKNRVSEECTVHSKSRGVGGCFWKLVAVSLDRIAPDCGKFFCKI